MKDYEIFVFCAFNLLKLLKQKLVGQAVALMYDKVRANLENSNKLLQEMFSGFHLENNKQR